MAPAGPRRLASHVLLAGSFVCVCACGSSSGPAILDGIAPDDGGLLAAADSGTRLGADAGAMLSTDGGPPSPGPSCAGLLATCGSTGAESCCASALVPGGTFDRSYDAVAYTDATNPATVSSLWLDRFKITVGRFRAFVDAVDAGWLPAAGSGKHTHLAGGAGLNGGTETGWDASWSSVLATTKAGWEANLACSATMATWTSAPGAEEDAPVNCLLWEEAYAFCIWDGGFLPTEAEWNFAAAGGSEQRVEPWSSPATSTTIDPTYASYDCMGDGVSGCTLGDIQPVGSRSPKGDGRWGHAALAGDLWEWNLDWFLSSYPQPCVDCAATQTGAVRVLRGGAWNSPATQVDTSYRNNQPPGRLPWVGARCARSP